MESSIGALIAGLPEGLAPGSPLWLLMKSAVLVGLLALVLTTFLGFSMGGVMAVKRFDSKPIVLARLTGMTGATGIVIAMMIYLAICYHTPQGIAGLMENPALLVVAQALLVLPAVTTGAQRVIEKEWRCFRPQLRFWRMTAQQALPTLFWKARGSLLWLFAATGGRIIAELGGLALLCTIADYVVHPDQRHNVAESWINVQLGGILLLAAVLILICVFSLPHRHNGNPIRH